ncbi:hypothetical protein ND748_01090 [Frankia sp. AiPs1]|uniref:hypothetical protein n=1 Tax=Frankia sp. AiPs1 TaxID=573493 RepID=UPI002043E9A8|nr:hypothetical protein [Frankia sp. AiPs1]MCM3920284.1 hypothetical protein [Frankia sp. AiPs1]
MTTTPRPRPSNPPPAPATELASGRWSNLLADRSPVKIEVPGGWWRINPIIRRGVPGSVAAELFTQPQARWPQLQARGYIWRVEEMIGFPLPAAAHAALRRAPAQPFYPRRDQIITTDDVLRDGALRPQPTSATQINGRPPTPFADLRDGRPLRRWEHGDVRVDILTAGVSQLRAATGSRLSYRIFHQELVMFAGDDVTIPATMSPRSDAALQRVVAGLAGQWDRNYLNDRQRDFIGSHGPTVVAAAQLQPGLRTIPLEPAPASDPAPLDVPEPSPGSPNWGLDAAL